MISALVLANDRQDQLARCLASLIPGIAEGVLRDGAIMDPAGDSSIAHIADEAGCGYVRSDAVGLAAYQEGLDHISAPWVLCVGAEVELDIGWVREAGRHCERSSKTGVFQRSQSGLHFQAFGHFVFRLVFNAVPLNGAVLLPRDALKNAQGRFGQAYVSGQKITVLRSQCFPFEA